MRIAVVSEAGKSVGGKCGKARDFLLYWAEQGKPICCMATLSLTAQQPDFHDLHDDDATPHPLDGYVLITGEAGEGLTERLARRDITVHITSETDPHKAVELLLAGTLPKRDPHPHGADGICPGDH
uniref:Dinitrogenase iron-molybdenum cofactor biosynthesis domain-containing protein n=1 Tax=Magnetococcus massalia (strain MO-1) TaxID=451514 RepID=A0A1S7LIJ2_MAGMO|nr:conserved protein of unknown function [Candidatus Magnetococcus massalia]